MKHIQSGDFPRTGWNESAGVRSVLMRAFNTSRRSEKRLLALKAWLQFLTNRVNAALLELETAAQVKQEPVVSVPVVEMQDIQVEVPVMVVPTLGELIDVEGQVNG